MKITEITRTSVNDVPAGNVYAVASDDISGLFLQLQSDELEAIALKVTGLDGKHFQDLLKVTWGRGRKGLSLFSYPDAALDLGRAEFFVDPSSATSNAPVGALIDKRSSLCIQARGEFGVAHYDVLKRDGVERQLPIAFSRWAITTPLKPYPVFAFGMSLDEAEKLVRG